MVMVPKHNTLMTHIILLKHYLILLRVFRSTKPVKFFKHEKVVKSGVRSTETIKFLKHWVSHQQWREVLFRSCILFLIDLIASIDKYDYII